MASRIIGALALLALTAGGLVTAANPAPTSPPDAATISAEAAAPPAVRPGIVEVSGTAATSTALGAEVWTGGAQGPLPGTSVRNMVMGGRREASDPRLTGAFESRSSCDYELVDTGYVGSCWGLLAFDHDDGTWEGMGTSTVTWNAAAMTMTLVEDYLVLGHGGFAGLAHRGRSVCVPGGHLFECTWNGVIEPVFTPTEIELDLAVRTTHWTGTWRPTAIEEPAEGRIGTFDGRCSRPAFALHHTVTEGFDSYLGSITATMTYCWYRTFGAEVSGTIAVADGSTLTFAADQITMGTNALGNWQRNDLAITGGTGRFTGAAGGGSIWGETADVDAVLAGADPPRAWLSLAIVVRPAAAVKRP